MVHAPKFKLNLCNLFPCIYNRNIELGKIFKNVCEILSWDSVNINDLLSHVIV